MKTILLLLILSIAVSANSQSLKDALYSGKLKTDSGTTIRKGEDLTSKIDTSTKKPVDISKTKTIVVTTTDSATGQTVQRDSVVLVAVDSVSVPGSVAATTAIAVKENNVSSKDNNKLWKDYMDTLVSGLRTEVLPSKKIKDGYYSVLVEYEIGLDGQVSVNNVSIDPESSFLSSQIKERLTMTAPQLTPLLGTNGKPRKAVKKYTFTLSK